MVITPLELLYVLLYTPRILGAISRNVQNRFLLPRIHHIGCWGGTEFMVRHLFSKRWCDPVNWLKFFFPFLSSFFFFLLFHCTNIEEPALETSETSISFLRISTLYCGERGAWWSQEEGIYVSLLSARKLLFAEGL